MLVCDEHKFVFLRIPKTASRSISKALTGMFDCRTVGYHHNNKVPKELMEYFCFAVVRNPYERAISAWLHWEKDLQKHGKNLFFNSYLERNSQPCFPEMTREYLLLMGDSDNEYWKTQSEFIEEANANVHVLKYENLEEDLNALPFIEKIEPPLVGKQNYGNWRDYYGWELETRVFQHQKADFENFGYKRWACEHKFFL